MKSVLLFLGALALPLLGLQAATSVGILEPEPAGAKNSRVPIALSSTLPDSVVALQADVQFNASLYTVSDAEAVLQPAGVKVESAEISPGRMRVVVYHRNSEGLGGNVLFAVPLIAKNGVVSNDPILLTDLIVAGQGGSAVTAGIQPRVRLTGLRDGQKVNGRLGIELTSTASATDSEISYVEYYVGGVLLGEGEGPNFKFFWEPETSGPYEIRAVAYDENGLQSSTRTIPIIVTHVGTYDGPVLGTYAGLVRAPAFSFDQEGYVSMTSTVKGAFTLKLLMGGKTLSGKGQFDGAGNATVSIVRGKGITPLTVVLAHSTDAQVDQIHGRVADGSFVNNAFTGNTFESEFVADRLVWNAKTLPAVKRGSYMVLLPASEDAQVQGAPRGTGFATAIVAPAGTVSSTLNLADGTKITASSIVSKDGSWPLYASLYKAKGVILGEMTFDPIAEVSDVDGQLTWLRPADAKALQFKPGFQTTVDAVGGLFVKPVANQRLIPLANLGSNASLFFSEGGLLSPVENRATILASNKALVPLQDALRPTVLPVTTTGLLSGAFFHPDTQKSVKYQGAVLQKQQLFGGYFLAGTHGGDVSLAANEMLSNTVSGPIGTSPLPVVKIVSPKANATLASVIGESVTISGTAADKQGIASVTYQVLHDGVLSAPATATGTTAWSFPVPVPNGEGGLYIVHVKATDTVGHESEVVTAQFWTPLKSALAVTVSGPGTVTKGFEGSTERDVGKLVTLSAKPNAKKRFLGWTGSVTSSSLSITVLMKEGTALQANFGD